MRYYWIYIKVSQNRTLCKQVNMDSTDFVYEELDENQRSPISDLYANG